MGTFLKIKVERTIAHKRYVDTKHRVVLKIVSLHDNLTYSYMCFQTIKFQQI